jgi:alkanesulfonate monooxygenase SsuD/methylene tetrahydromethanopterin reductase-like flavin-dependent oxidoreductase (luciferase family)
MATVAAGAGFVEEAGLESVWSGDHLISDVTPLPDSTLLLATAAATTTRLRVGLNVMVLPLRPVAWAAKQIATLQHLSGNRMLLGIGVGAEHHGWKAFSAVGVDRRRRGELTDTALGILPDLVAGKPVDLGGEVVRIEPGAQMPPLLFGGGPVGARRAARFGGDWLPAIANPATIFAFLPRLRELAQQHHRPTPAITVTVGLALGRVSDEDFQRQLHMVMAHGLSEHDARAAIVTGGPDEAAHAIGSLADAGAARVIAVPFTGDWHEQVTLLGDANKRLTNPSSVHTSGGPG